MNTPEFRKAKASKKKAVLVSSSAAPTILGRWVFNTHKQLKTTVNTIGADSTGTLFTGLIAKEPHQVISTKVQAKARALALKLVL